MSDVQILCHVNDLVIDREQVKGEVRLYDCDGEYLFALPGSMEDAEIRKALMFANWAFARGVRFGMSKKASEIRAMLEIPEPPMRVES